MAKMKLLRKLNSLVNFQLPDLNSRVLNGVLRVKSQPLTVREKPAIVFSPGQDDETIDLSENSYETFTALALKIDFRRGLIDCGGMIALKRSQGTPV